MSDLKRIIYSLENKHFFAVFSVIIALLILNISLVKIFQFTSDETSSSEMIFSYMVALFIISQFIISKFIRAKMKVLGHNFQHDLRLISFVVYVAQYFLVGILLIILYQVVIMTGFDSFLFKITVWFCYLEAIFLTGFIAYKFLLWLRVSLSYVVVLYTAAIVILLINIVFTLIYVNDLLLSYSSFIQRNGNAYVPYISQNTILTYGYQISTIASYLSMWGASVVLLNNQSRRIGKAKYWILVSIPLIYYVIQFQPLILQFFINYRYYYPIFFGITYTLFFSASTTIGGILFGLAFWNTARKITVRQVRDFMIMTGYGLALFFTSNQANIVGSASYPPFGITIIAFVGQAASMIVVGIYALAISLAHDVNLRKTIRISLNQQSLFLDKIGISEMEHQMEKKIFVLTKKVADQLSNESGIQASLEEKDIKNYIEEVLSEIKDSKSTT